MLNLRNGSRTGLVVVLSLCLPMSVALAASPCVTSVAVRSGDTLSSIADRCDVSEAALLNANPAIEGSGDLQVGRTLQIDPSGSTQGKVGSVLNSFSRKATNAVGALAGNVGSSVQDLLDKNPDLKRRLDTLGSKVGLTDSATAATLTVAPSSGAPGSHVAITATGLPKSSPVAIGAGPPGSAYAVVGNAQTTASGTLDTSVTVPESQAAATTLVFNVSTGDGVLVRSDRFSVVP